MAWVLDLDGVMWLAHEPIPGSSAAVADLLGAGEDVVFVTNNSSAPVRAVESALEEHGVDAVGRVVTSAMAGAMLVEPGERALVCGGAGIVEALTDRGVEVVEDPAEADVVVVGMARHLSYDLLARASSAARDGARLVATNDDSTYPTPTGLLPGGGAILAAVERASGRTAAVAGKPHAPMADLVRARLGPAGTVVGDRPDTDGRFARALGYRFALVLSGVTTHVDLPVVPAPDVVAADLAEVVASWARDRPQVAG